MARAKTKKSSRLSASDTKQMRTFLKAITVFGLIFLGFGFHCFWETYVHLPATYDYLAKHGIRQHVVIDYCVDNSLATGHADAYCYLSDPTDPSKHWTDSSDTYYEQKLGKGAHLDIFIDPRSTVYFSTDHEVKDRVAAHSMAYVVGGVCSILIGGWLCFVGVRALLSMKRESNKLK